MDQSEFVSVPREAVEDLNLMERRLAIPQPQVIARLAEFPEVVVMRLPSRKPWRGPGREGIRQKLERSRE